MHMVFGVCNGLVKYFALDYLLTDGSNILLLSNPKGSKKAKQADGICSE